MNYHDGSTIHLGDTVKVPIPGGTAQARVVMLGDTYEHLVDIDSGFLEWVQKEKQLEASAVVVEWLVQNPFAHSDPRYAPAGNYMFSTADEWLEKDVHPTLQADAVAQRDSS